jgi:hypothetical protein
MKNLVAIFLATALLVGCGEDNYVSDGDRASLYGWCVNFNVKASGFCAFGAQVVQDLVNEAGFDKDCVIQDFKMSMITSDAEVLISSRGDCR